MVFFIEMISDRVLEQKLPTVHVEVSVQDHIQSEWDAVLAQRISEAGHPSNAEAEELCVDLGQNAHSVSR